MKTKTFQVVTRWFAFDSILLLAVLTGLYPSLFFLSKNWFVFSFAQRLYLILSLTAAALTVLLTLHFLFSRTRLPRRVARSAVVLVAVYLLVGYFDFVVVDLERRYGSFDVRGAITIALSAVAALLLMASWRKPQGSDPVRHINIGLAAMTLMAFLSLGMSVAGNYSKMFSASSPDANQTATYDQVRFQSTPNIYLLIPDSYPSNPVLKRFFHYDNGKFSTELQNLGFRVYDDYFSSYPYSVESVHSMLSMSHNYLQKTIGNDAIGLREIIGGRNNDVMRILANNGYKSVFIHQTDYLFKEHCYIERCLPKLSEYEMLWSNLQNHYFFSWLPWDGRRYDVADEMKDQIRNTPANSRAFIYGHFMGAHSGVKALDALEQNRLVLRKHYPSMIATVNRMLLEQIREISRHDPSAVIVIVGDHGTWAGANRTESALTPDETLDKFHVFLAIRWGDAYKGQYDDKVKSGVNLFRYVFAYLSESESILETRVADESYLLSNGAYKVVEDGAVMDKAELYTPD
jgi:hypothetical protein